MKSRTNEVKWTHILVLLLFIIDLLFEEQEKGTSPEWAVNAREGALAVFLL